MIYPYFFSSGCPLRKFRITRPTDCTTSTCELREERNKTASRAGTSIPSERQRTFVSTRHSFSPIFSSASHASCSLRACEFIEPSIWRACTSTTCSRSSVLMESRYFSQIVGNTSAVLTEVPGEWLFPMAEQKAIALCITVGSASHVACLSPRMILERPFTIPINFDVSSKFNSTLLGSFISERILSGKSSSFTVSTRTL